MSSFRRRPELEPLELRLTPAPMGLPRVAEKAGDNDSAATAQAVTPPDVRLYDTDKDGWLTIDGALDRLSDVDFFAVTLPRRAALAIDVDLFSLQKVPKPILPEFAVLGANGTTLFEANGGIDYFTGQDGNDPSLYLDLQAGTYFFRIGAGLDGRAFQAALADPAAAQTLRELINGGSPGAYEIRVLTDSQYTSTIPIFESHPAARTKLYLDFDGHATASDVWSATGYRLTPIQLTGFGHVSAAAEFSPGELLLYKTIWRTVAENFAPFQVDITTREPAAFANGVALRNVVADRASYFLPDFNVGYARFVGFQFEAQQPSHTFLDGRVQNESDNTRAFVNKGQTTGEYVSHEIGHALGLNHGGSTGPTPFEPILPATPPVRTFPNNARTWTIGVDETGGQVNQMDVLAGAANGFGYRVDTNNALNTAVTLTAMGNTYARKDVIEKSDDVDYYRFRGRGATTIAVTVEPGVAVANLDSVVEVYRAGQTTPFLTANPANTRDVVLQTTLDEGDYIVAVKGIGRIVTPVRSFDVVGGYTLSVTTTVAQTNQPPTVTLPGAAVAFARGSAAVLLDANATVSDADSPHFNGGSLTVRISANGDAADLLDVKNEANIVEQLADGRVRVRGKVIGTRTEGPGSQLAYQFTTTDATPDAVADLLRSVTFATTSTNTTTRTVEVVVNDGQAASAAATKQVTVSVPAPPPMSVVENQGVTAPVDAPKVLAAGTLRVTSPAQQDTKQIVFTLTRTPAQGRLLLSKPSDVPDLPNFLPFALVTGDGFTQDDLDSGRLSYRLNVGNVANADSFAFTVRDDKGNALPEQTFAVRVSRGTAPVGGGAAAFRAVAASFQLAGETASWKLAATEQTTSATVTVGAHPTSVTLGRDRIDFAVEADPHSLRFDIVAAPRHGSLSLPTTFTQQDVNDNLLVYRAPAASDIPAGATEDRFVYVVTDTGTGGVSDPITFTISYINNNAPPEFTDGDVTLGLIPFYTGAPRSAATTLRDLLRGRFSDADSREGTDMQPGVAITRIDSANGRWEYTTDGGETWQALENVSEMSALLLSGGDDETAVRFFPNAGFSGSVDLGLRLWDQTEGQRGQRFDLTAAETGGFSAAVGRAVLVVPAEERDPSFVAGSAQTVVEDAGPVVVPHWATAIQGEDVVFLVDPSFASDTVPGDASTLRFAERPTIDAAGTLRFRAADDSFGSATFFVTATSGERNSATLALTITVRSVNDAPTFTAGPDVQVTAGAGPVQLIGWATGLSAGPVNEASQTLNVNLTTDNPALFAVAPALDLATGTLTFTPAATGSGTARVSVNLGDDGGTTDGGQNATTRVLRVILAAPASGIRVEVGVDAEWVNQTYRDLLGREAEAGGLRFWTDARAQGVSRAGVVAAIRGSGEYATRQAAQLYRVYLRREADADGLAHLARMLQNGATFDQARATLLASAEYYTIHGGSDAGFLSGLYDDILHRDIDESGRVSWSRVLAAGAGREQVTTAILQSDEASRAP